MITPVKLWRNQKYLHSGLGKAGTIISFTLIRSAPIGFEPLAPYPVVLVEMGNTRLMGQLVDFGTENLCFGQKVISVLRRVREPEAQAVIVYGIKFKPINE